MVRSNEKAVKAHNYVKAWNPKAGQQAQIFLIRKDGRRFQHLLNDGWIIAPARVRE